MKFPIFRGHALVCFLLVVFSLPAAAQTDLGLSEVSVNNNITYQTGGPITIEAEVDNLGNATSAPFTVNFYVSTDLNITPGDILLGSANRPALGAGNSDNFSVNLVIPVGLAGGNYFIGAIIDINDANNGNNSNAEDEAIIVQSSGLAFVVNNGLNDAWFDPLTPGQGFFITVFPDRGEIFLAWFTYDTERPPGNVIAILGEPGHRWLTAFGTYSGSFANLDIELTQGGVFDSSQPEPVQSDYGTIQIEFIDCNNAIIRYDIPSLGLMGEISITRIALDNVLDCLAAQPQ
jgi:hypothetical protein